VTVRHVLLSVALVAFLLGGLLVSVALAFLGPAYVFPTVLTAAVTLVVAMFVLYPREQ